MRTSSILAFGTLALVVGCRGGSGDDTNIDAPAVVGAVTIQQVQSDSMPPGTAVALQGVVVTAIDTFGAKTGDIWVEEPTGGAFSGVHVFNAPVSVVATLSVGDIVNISGAVKAEFALTGSNADTTGRTETELEPPTAGGSMTVTKTGTGTVPAPAVVDALAIGEMYDASMAAAGGGTAFSNAWAMWDGVLVTTANVSALSAPKAFGSVTPTPADSYDFGITGVAKVEGNFVDITSESVARNSCLNVTGVVSYFYDYLVLPRTTADLVTGGTGCPAAETVCGDSIDNDGNGFADCADDNCIITSGSCHSTMTITQLDQAADAAPTSPTLPAADAITGACVTAISGTNMYVAANGTAAADGGIFVFGGGQALPVGVVVGSTVDVVGSVTSFKSTGSTAPEGELEIGQLQITKDVATCTVAPKSLSGANAALSTLATDAGGHPLIGSLVTLNPTGSYKVTKALTSTVHFGTLTQGTTVISFGSSLLTTIYTRGCTGHYLLQLDHRHLDLRHHRRWQLRDPADPSADRRRHLLIKQTISDTHRDESACLQEPGRHHRILNRGGVDRVAPSGCVHADTADTAATCAREELCA